MSDVKVLVLFGEPLDSAAFDEHFESVHRPLLRELPDLDRYVVNRVAGAAIGESPFSILLELHFPSEEAMQRGLNSAAGQAMAADYGLFASRGVTVLFAQSQIEAPDA